MTKIIQPIDLSTHCEQVRIKRVWGIRMIIKKLLCAITALILLWVGMSTSASAESRNIYVGDIITLEISSLEMTGDELRQKFQDFEIVEMKEEPEGYTLSIRTFETGEYIILLGDKEIVINVASTLKDIDRDDVFDGEKEILAGGIPIYWRIILYITLSIFVLSGGVVLVKLLKKRREKPESAYQLFLRRCTGLSESDDNYFVHLTFYFKQYLESIHNIRIIGKTSAEIVSELKVLSSLEGRLSDIKAWLEECDLLKFSGTTVSSDDKHRHFQGLLGIVENIEMDTCSINEETI